MRPKISLLLPGLGAGWETQKVAEFQASLSAQVSPSEGEAGFQQRLGKDHGE